MKPFLFVQHLAAAKGHLDCVLLLLDFGTDPNKRGTFIIPNCTRRREELMDV